MPGKPKVAIVILNWNGKEFLKQFLPGVIRYSKDVADVIVADNDSSDDSVEFLKGSFPEVRVIRNSENGGYAKGYNDALAQVDARYYVLLNSDIEVNDHWIDPVIGLMERDPSIAACQPKLLSFYKRDHFEYAGAAGGFIDRFGYPFCRGRIFQSMEKDEGQYDDVREVFWATGACMFVRADVYHELGGLDERFFAHMEEIDFCWRAKRKGYRIFFCPDSKVFHVGGGTLPKRSWKKTYLNMRNNNIMLFKNLPSHRLWRVFIARLVLDGIAALKFLIDGGVMDMWAVIRAHGSFYAMIPALKRERGQDYPSDISCMYRKNLVFEYFILKRRRFSQLDPGRFSMDR